MFPGHRLSWRLSALLALLMVAQAGTGLLFPDLYRDRYAGWTGATWFGNDWITLALAVPLLVAGLARARRGSTRGLLLWLGILGYAVYNYCFYLLGTPINVHFPLYVSSFLLAAAALILGLVRVQAGAVRQAWSREARVRPLGGYYVFAAAGLTAVWMGQWAAHVFGGRPAPGGEEAFRLVAALDMMLMVPALGVGGALLLGRRAWGFVIAPIAGVQASLYLTLLALNAVLLGRLGFPEVEGQLAIWMPLAGVTTLVTVLLLAGVGRTKIGSESAPPAATGFDASTASGRSLDPGGAEPRRPGPAAPAGSHAADGTGRYDGTGPT